MSDPLTFRRRERAAWLTGGLAAFAVSMLVGGVAACRPLETGPKQTEQQSQTYQHKITAIEFDVQSGDITVTGGGGSDINVDRRLVWRKTKPTIDEQWNGDTLRIVTTCPESSCETNYTVRLPAAVTLNARNEAGNITIRGVTGAQQVTSDAGELRVDGAQAKLTLQSHAGNITVTGAASTDVDAGSDAGTVTVHLTVVPTSVSARSSAGTIEVVVPKAGSDGYRVQADTNAGHRTVSVDVNDSSPHVIVARTEAGDVRILYS